MLRQPLVMTWVLVTINCSWLMTSICCWAEVIQGIIFMHIPIEQLKMQIRIHNLHFYIFKISYYIWSQHLIFMSWRDLFEWWFLLSVKTILRQLMPLNNDKVIINRNLARHETALHVQGCQSIMQKVIRNPFKCYVTKKCHCNSG